MLCISPNCAPSNPARSTAKLLISANQVADDSGMAAAISISRNSGLRQFRRSFCRMNCMGNIYREFFLREL